MNRLAGETSPYLLQHRDNPVDWYPWGDEAFEKARREMKLIFLSIGYSSCHWCHVMERESFENEEIAAVLNEHFVSIKVDREERPDVDGLYMEVVQAATGHGGWPLSVFLLPDGRPVYGGTYFPPVDRYGHPGFKRVLESVATVWRTDPNQLVGYAGQLTHPLGFDLMAQAEPSPLAPGLLDQAFETLSKGFDPEEGGFGQAPKFPQPATLLFLLREYGRTGNERARDMALLTLDKMALGGIYDHLGGGFHRYSTDRSWLVPHFEKMLYDNALLVRAYLQAYQITRELSYRMTAVETLRYLLRDMQSPGGGFYTAEDADSEGEEGRFYVWTEEEVRHLLGEEDARLFGDCYDVTPAGNWEGRTILRVVRPVEEVAEAHGVPVDRVYDALRLGRERLLEARGLRTRPGLDDKILTSWNGLLLTALVEAYDVLRDEAYLRAAERNASFLLEHAYAGGRLMRSTKEGRARHEGFVEDYAFLAEGLVALYEATGAARWLEAASEMAGHLVSRYWDDASGGFFFTEASTELIARRKEVMDNAVPAGNSVAVHLLQRLGLLLDRPEWREKARLVLERLAPVMARYPSGFGYLLSAVGFELEPPPEIAVVGPEPEYFLAPLHERFLPNKVVAFSTADPGPDPPTPLLAGKTALDGRTTAYVCRNYACRAPVTDLAEFLALLE